jgi:hypothetical protein
VRRERGGGVARSAAEVEHALATRQGSRRQHGVEIRAAAVHGAHGVGRSGAPEALLDAGFDRLAARLHDSFSSSCGAAVPAV